MLAQRTEYSVYYYYNVHSGSQYCSGNTVKLKYCSSKFSYCIVLIMSTNISVSGIYSCSEQLHVVTILTLLWQ